MSTSANSGNTKKQKQSNTFKSSQSGFANDRIVEEVMALFSGRLPSDDLLQFICEKLSDEGKLSPEKLKLECDRILKRVMKSLASEKDSTTSYNSCIKEEQMPYQSALSLEVTVMKDILKEFLEIVIPRMIDKGYALKPAKSQAYEQGRHEASYYVDQSLRTHVLNGLFAITRLLGYLQREDIFSLSEEDFRRVLALYPTHDLHKDEELEKGNRGEFDIPLEQIEQEIEDMGISDFVNTTPAEHRLAMIHIPSPKVGDASAAPSGTLALIPIIRLADSLASMQSAREYKTVQNRLNEVLSRQMRTRPEKARDFYFHELNDYRGLSTLLIHQATASKLEERFELFPLLYFPNGVLYVGPLEIDFSGIDTLRHEIAQALLEQIQSTLAPKGPTIAADAIRTAQSVKFRKDVYLFADRANLLKSLSEFASRKGEKNVISQRFGKRLRTKLGRPPTEQELSEKVNSFCEKYAVELEREHNHVFSENWACVWKFTEGVESIAKALVGEDVLNWLFEQFKTPGEVRERVTSHRGELIDGGVSDHCLVIAYHYLVNKTFGDNQRAADEVEPCVILNELVGKLYAALTNYDTVEKRLAFVNDKIGLQMDLDSYLASNLSFSFAFDRQITSTLPAYSKTRSGSHGRLCVICNREVPREMGEKKIKTDIAETKALVFSNRIVPTEKVGGQMVWCPICYFEFMLRKLTGEAYVQNADVDKSQRLYLYILPDYSFTPDFWEFAEEVLEPFALVTDLKLRQFGPDDDPSIPRLWINNNCRADNEMLEGIRSLFCREAERLTKVTEKTKKAFKDIPGERLHLPKLEHPNYMLLTYEVSVGRGKRYQKLAPTTSELWAKAAYAGCLLQLLLGVRVYITDKPYLPMAQPDEMKAVIQLDAPHILLRGVINGGTSVSLDDLRKGFVDILSAAWEVNAALSGGQGNLDKQIAGVLERINTSEFAGATFYKERERNDKPIYDAFEKACQILFGKKGGDMMELVQELTNRSLNLFIPSARKEGKAHRYETMFRTAVEMIKKNPKVSDDELIARVGGTIVKRLERINGGSVPLHGQELKDAALDFVSLVVKNLFRGRCKGSSARLTHEENALADAIYFLTDQQISERWEKYKAARAEKGQSTQQSEENKAVANNSGKEE